MLPHSTTMEATCRTLSLPLCKVLSRILLLPLLNSDESWINLTINSIRNWWHSFSSRIMWMPSITLKLKGRQLRLSLGLPVSTLSTGHWLTAHAFSCFTFCCSVEAGILVPPSSSLLTLACCQYSSCAPCITFSMQSSNCYSYRQKKEGENQGKKGRKATNKTRETGWHLINACFR